MEKLNGQREMTSKMLTYGPIEKQMELVTQSLWWKAFSALFLSIKGQQESLFIMAGLSHEWKGPKSKNPEEIDTVIVSKGKIVGKL